MPFTSVRFLELACRWAYDHHTLFIEDDAFLPEIKSQGVSDNRIQQFKEELGRQGAIKNHRVVTGMRDFEISQGIFRQYLQRVLPAATLAKARTLYESWKRSPKGPFSATIFVEHLGVSETEATYYLEALQG
jgi:hypothetical protein